MKRFFWGGVHPAGHKELTHAPKLTVLPAPPQVIVPLSQHIGAPAQPLVAVGDYVTMGQKIGDGQGLCVPVHAPVSGKVSAIGDYPHPGGMRPAIVIDNDFQDTFASNLHPHGAEEELDAKEILSIIREAGIVGMGGASFPTAVKASVPEGQVDVVIVNACECEPYITADDTLLQTQPGQVVDGLKLLCKVMNPKRGVIAVEDNKPAAIAAVRKALAAAPELELRVLHTRYPQGAEKQLIQAVTGRQVKAGKLPKDAGCAVFNAATCAAIFQAVRDGMPLIQRIVSVTGPAVNAPANFLARIGTTFGQAVEAAGGLRDNVWKVLSGGPMMGVAQPNLDAPIVKFVNCILCLSQAENAEVENPVCFRCGKCVDACPMHLQPLYLHRYTKSGNLALLKQYNIMDCIECGCCAYACPGKVPLVASIRSGKKLIKEGSAQ